MKKVNCVFLLIFGCVLLIAATVLISSCEKDDGIYTASFYADGELIEKVEFKKGDKEIDTPIVPKKKGLVGAWESYRLKDKDIRIDAVYAESFTVKIVADDPYAFSFLGQTEQKITSRNPRMLPVRIDTNDGYLLDYYEIDGVRYDNRNIMWKNVNADTTIVVHSKLELDELPVICIDTQGEPIKSKYEYTQMVFDLKNCDGKLTNIEGGIRLRGNSTLGYPKVAYRIKFDKKQSLFGLEKVGCFWQNISILPVFITTQHLRWAE